VWRDKSGFTKMERVIVDRFVDRFVDGKRSDHRTLKNWQENVLCLQEERKCKEIKSCNCPCSDTTARPNIGRKYNSTDVICINMIGE
jgi:hypothetical protein